MRGYRGNFRKQDLWIISQEAGSFCNHCLCNCLAASTISRISNNKYVETPFGLLEIKYFFTSGIPCSRRGEVSSESVKFRIRQIIETENKIKPLSDNKILKILESDGLKIARRTVSKYREAMGILSTRQRKVLRRA